MNTEQTSENIFTDLPSSVDRFMWCLLQAITRIFGKLIPDSLIILNKDAKDASKD